MALNIHLFIVFTLLLLLLIIKIYYHKPINSVSEYKNFYSKADKSAIGVSLTMSLLGSSALVISIEKTYHNGIIFIIFSCGYIIANLITAKFIIPKFDDKFTNAATVADLFGHYYGNAGEKISAIASIIFDLTMLICQQTILSHLIKNTFNIELSEASLITAIYFVFFSCISSFRVSLKLDIIKCASIFTFFPILASLATKNAGGLLKVIENLPDNYFINFDHSNCLNFLFIFCIIILPFSTLQPVNIQRVLLINDSAFSKKSHYLYGLLRSILIWTTSAIAVSAVTQQINNENILIYFVLNQMPNFLISITIFSILMFIIVKTDTHLNSIGLIATKNLFKFNTKIVSEKFLCCFSMFIANTLAFTIIVKMIDGFYVTIISQLFLSIFIGIPLIFAIFDFRTSKTGLIIYTILNVLAIPVVFNSSNWWKTTFFLLLFNIIFFLFINHLEQKHFRILNRKTFFPSLYRKFTKIPFYFYSVLPNFRNLLHYSSSKVEAYGADYFSFGIYFAVNYSIPYFSWEYEPETSNLEIIIRLISAFLCLILMLKKYWPEKISYLFPFYWHLTLAINLPLVNCFMLILHKWSVFWLLNFTLSNLLLMLITDWMTFIILTILGVIGAFILHILIIGSIASPLSQEPIYLAFYTLIYSILIGYVFVRRKEKSFDTKLEVTQILGEIIAHEIRTFLLIIKNYCSGLNTYLPKVIDGYNLAMNHSLLKNTIEKNKFKAIQSSLNNLDKTIKKSFSFIDLLLINIKGPITKKYKILSISECLNDVLSEYQLSSPEINFIFVNLQQEFSFLGNKEMLSHVVYNLLNNAIYFTINKTLPKIFIWLEKGEKENYLCISDNGPGIANQDLKDIFKRFFSKNKKGTGLGLSYCKLAMTSIGGDIYCYSVKGKYTEFRLKFPIINKDVI